jgi:hypothetical protein
MTDLASGRIFDSAFSSDVSRLRRLIISACIDADSSFSLKVAVLCRYHEWDELAELRLNPNEYSGANAYIKDNMVLGLIRKNAALPVIDTNPRLEAEKAFIKAEVKCALVNRQFITDPLLNKHGDDVHAIFHMASRKISKILGDVPHMSSLSFEFGPGAALNVSKNTSSIDKLDSSWDITHNAYVDAISFMETAPSWCASVGASPFSESDIIDRLNLVEGSRLTFVPKTATTDRPICIEPLLNGVIQKGYGSYIRDRLRKSGLDIKSCQGKHRRLAQLSSVNGDLCTIDLSSASDTISYMLVMSILPFNWFRRLDAVRSPHYTYQGTLRSFEKFSSMGNGYTFELETLIFYSLAKATNEYFGLSSEVCSVYGDDIIVPTECFDTLSRVLEACGFEVNRSKSFAVGPFRESCGGDYFSGTDARCFYLKDTLSPRLLILMYNFLERKGLRYWFPGLRSEILKMLPRAFMNFGPDDGTDGHLICLTRTFVSYTTMRSIAKTSWKHSDKYGVLALYRQMFTGFPQVFGLYEAILPYEGRPLDNRSYYKQRKVRVL